MMNLNEYPATKEHNMTTSNRDQQADTRRWAKQRRFDAYLELARLEPELFLLYRATKTIGNAFAKHKVSEDHIIDTWYHGGLRDRVIALVGHDALLACDPDLTGMRAYDIVYQTLVDLLYEPTMFNDCIEPEGKLVCQSISEIMNTPMVTSRRDGDDLVLEKWFNPKAMR